MIELVFQSWKVSEREMNNRAGHWKTNLSGEMAYQSFVPSPLPPTPPLEMTEDILELLIKANSHLGKCSNTHSECQFVCLHVCKERSTYVLPNRRHTGYLGGCS